MTTKKKIVIEGCPKGKFEACIISGTPKPGMRMQVVVGTARNANGLLTYEAFNPAGTGTTGNRGGPVAILVEDSNQGRGVSDAYASGDVGQVYFPLPGEEVLVLLDDGSDAVQVGDMLISRGDGTFTETTGAVEDEPFQAVETIGTIAADTLCEAKRR